MSGYVFDKDQLRSEMLGRGAYKSTLDQLSKSAVKSQGNAFQEYGDTIEQAYITSQRNRNIGDNSPMFSGYKDAYESGVDAQLDEIYKSAAEAYNKNIENIAQKYSSNVQNVYDAAGKESDYLDKYGKAHFDYYESISDDLAALPTIGEYFMKDGVPYTKEELYSKIYDVNGNLTEEGSIILDVLENVGEKYNWDNSFSNWLRLNDSELYDWGKSATASEDYMSTGAEQFRKNMNLTGDISNERLNKLMPNVNLETGEVILKDKNGNKIDYIRVNENSSYVPSSSVSGNVGKNWGKYNNFDVNINGVNYSLETGKPVEESSITDKLNAIVKSQSNKMPTVGDIASYKDSDGVHAYVYAKDKKWRSIGGRNEKYTIDNFNDLNDLIKNNIEFSIEYSKTEGSNVRTKIATFSDGKWIEEDNWRPGKKEVTDEYVKEMASGSTVKISDANVLAHFIKTINQ